MKTSFNNECRKKLERVIAKRAIKDLLAAGYFLTVNDGEEDTVICSKDPDQIFNAMFTTDEDRLKVYRMPDDEQERILRYVGWVYFIYGNDGPDVINDYTTNLDSVIQPIHDWCNDIEEGKFEIAA